MKRLRTGGGFLGGTATRWIGLHWLPGFGPSALDTLFVVLGWLVVVVALTYQMHDDLPVDSLIGV